MRPWLRRFAVCAMLASCVLAGHRARADEPSISDEARRHFKAGVALLEDPDGARVEDAYREFKAAYEQSSSPKILGNMGYCAMKLERDGEAIDAYSRYLRDVSDIDPEERAQIVRDLQTLTVGVVRLEIDATPPKAIVSDVRIPVKGDHVDNVYEPDAKGHLSIGIRPGHHIITARMQGFVTATWEFDAYAGAKEAHTFTLQAVTAPPRPAPLPIAPLEPPPTADRGAHRSVAPWILIGVGGALVATGAVTGAIALSKTNDISNSCPNDACPGTFDLSSARSNARTFVTTTDLLLLGGVVAAGAGVTWLLLEPSASSPPAADRAARVSGGAACMPGGCSGTVRVTF